MILMYHKIDLITPTEWWVSKSRFIQHVEILQKLKVVCLDDYNPDDPNHCVITFDDSYENIYRHAFPILRAKRYPFEIFINGDYLGKWNHFDKVEPLTRFCSLDQLTVMAANGGRIQWHTNSHPDLTSIELPAVLNELEVADWLRNHFPPPHFRWLAYPYGEHSPDIVNAAKNLFAGALSVANGSNTDKYMLNRITVNEQLDLESVVNERLGNI